jgi:hypothetical protein
VGKVGLSSKEVREEYAASMRSALTAKYGRIPSAEKISAQFNLRAAGVRPIGRETARRWIRGLVMPDLKQRKILYDWLGIDFPKAPSAISVPELPAPLKPLTQERAAVLAKNLAIENIDRIIEVLEGSKHWLAEAQERTRG